jgi:hypothetical protein
VRPDEREREHGKAEHDAERAIGGSFIDGHAGLQLKRVQTYAIAYTSIS